MARMAIAAAISLTAFSAPSGEAQSYRDSAGTVVQALALAGSQGRDFSVNAPAPPVVGANFSAAGPYASYVLLTSVAASPSRFSIDVENDSGGQVVVVRDDGAALAGSAPANASVFPLAGGPSAGSQGGAWSSQTFKGRVQIYAPAASAQVAIMVE